MRARYSTQLEIGEVTRVHQGIQSTIPAAFVNIDTDDIELHNRILAALTQIEDLEV